MGYRDVVLADRALGYWRLNDSIGSTAVDSSGGAGNAGTYQASPTLGAPGPIVGDPQAKAVSLNGTSQYVNVPTASAYNIGTLSLEAWVNTTASGVASRIMMRDDSGSNRDWQWDLSDGTSVANGCLRIIVFPSVAVIGGVTPCNDGKWHHVVTTYDGTNFRFYVDARLDATNNPGNGNITAAGAPIHIGANASGGPFQGFGGSLAECAIYSGQVSHPRILAHYRAGKGLGYAQGLWTPDRRRRAA